MIWATAEQLIPIVRVAAVAVAAVMLSAAAFAASTPGAPTEAPGSRRRCAQFRSDADRLKVDTTPRVASSAHPGGRLPTGTKPCSRRPGRRNGPPRRLPRQRLPRPSRLLSSPNRLFRRFGPPRSPGWLHPPPRPPRPRSSGQSRSIRKRRRRIQCGFGALVDRKARTGRTAKGTNSHWTAAAAVGGSVVRPARGRGMARS